jgi:HD-like signal output (HDOD) protein
VVTNSTSDYNDIAQIISIDPPLTFGLLTIVNNAFYCFLVKIGTVSRKLVVEGTEQLMQLFLATMVVRQFSVAFFRAFNLPQDFFKKLLFVIAFPHRLKNYFLKPSPFISFDR